MVVLGFLYLWKRWAGCVLLTFSGPARIGETVRGKRSHLVFPADMLYDPSDRCFLKIVNPKSKRRGGAPTRHITVVGPFIVRLIADAFGSLSLDDRLYPFSASTFRARWNFLLRQLDVKLPFVPASRRGGGAVHAYMHDVGNADLQWKMRIKGMTTLIHYIQEVAAATLLSDLSICSRALVEACAALFSHLCPK